MKSHPPYHWIAVTLALAASLLTLSELHGQSTGAAATFEGRPAMAGAQAGLGAQAGPPQGGLGVQGTDMAQVGVGRAATPANPASASDASARSDVKPGRDQSIAKDQRSATQKAKRAVKRTISRSRHGNAPIDSQGAPAAR
ncbi:MAG TPA: hypothetical protein VLI46_09525 [Ramlibacter sp.]|nr:hypothetical protein [Ramlibacter sp.]